MGNFAVSAGEELYQFDQVDFYYLLFLLFLLLLLLNILFSELN